ncbi:MAG: penicillin-binding transpeptidase domain-containing protein [Clostridia bacterium]|nr:penicillin-binding transpeptidase domain-containing protein [Clostridia bacterium]
MPISLSSKKKMRNGLFVVIVIILLLTTRLGYIQLVWGAELNNQATSQQSQSRKITAKRGTIYDATGKYELAVSSSVEAVTINPTNISKENKEKVAKALSDIFELDYEKVLKRLNKRSSIETIVKQVEKSKTDELRKWMEENQITRGINIDEDSKRYYPYGDLAAQVIGFCGNDNQGLDGIEAKYNDELKGKNGKIERQTNAAGESLGDEEYISTIDGNSLILTIDMTIQSIVEKYLEEACIDNVCTDGGSIIAMNPKNGDILAMATYPAYDLNSPYEPHTDEQKAEWKNLDSQDRTTAMQKMWRNKAISDTYEPGSVFKTITSSAALEEGIVTDIDKQGQFCCTGGIEVAGVRIKCWRYYRPHGSESLRLALMNSCNPVFIGLGQKIGVTKYYEYLRKFGLFNKTGIKLPGEANSIFIKEEKAGPVELATISFGQRFEITPLQMVTAVSSIANKGTYIKPRIVKSIINSETGEKTDMPIETGEQIISKENAEKVLSMMNSVVSEGTGKNAKVEGYQVGGKTGTSEDGVNTGKYVTSFCGVANTDDPEIVLLITLYNPTGEGGHQGGGVAAPVGGKILSEVLPYLDSKTDV